MKSIGNWRENPKPESGLRSGFLSANHPFEQFSFFILFLFRQKLVPFLLVLFCFVSFCWIIIIKLALLRTLSETRCARTIFAKQMLKLKCAWKLGPLFLRFGVVIPSWHLSTLYDSANQHSWVWSVPQWWLLVTMWTPLWSVLFAS